MNFTLLICSVDKSTFVSAIQGSHIKETTNKESYIRLRVSVSSFRLVVSKEEDKSQLVASIEDTVVSYSNIQNDETDLPNSDKIPSTGKVSITMSEIKLKEFYQNSEKTLLSFHNPVDSKSIFSSPNLEIDVDFRGLGIDSEIHVKMNFQPILLSFGSLSVANWIETIVGMIPTKSEASPSTNFSLEISIPEINCFVLSDHRIPLDWWKELRKALRLQSNPSVWKEFATKYRQIFLTQLVGQSGGLHFNFQDLNICFSTMEDKYVHKEDNHLLAIEQVSMGLFIRDDQGKMLKTDLIKASSNKEQTEKVTVKRYEIDFSNNSIYNSQLSTSIFGDASKGIIEDMGPKPPKVEGKNMIHINAYRLELGK